MSQPTIRAPQDRRALVAVDLGAESCRISLLRWHGDTAEITLVHRFPNGPVRTLDTLHWDVLHLYGEMLAALRQIGRAHV